MSPPSRAAPLHNFQQFYDFTRGITAGLALAAMALATPLPASAAEVCVIIHVAGTAEVSARGAGRHEAAPGLGLGRNAHLRTGPDARVSMTCPDGLEVIVGPDSTFAVSGVLDGATQQPFGLRLMEGIAGFLFDRAGGDGVQVRTPSAVAAVRSTEWTVQAEDGASAFFTREGRIFVAAGDDGLWLDAGEGVDVSADGEIGPALRWGQPRIDRQAELLGPGW